MTAALPPRLLAVATAVLAVAACSPRVGAPPFGEAGLRFTEVAASAGLGQRGPSYAAAAADVDGDGQPDLAVSRHGSIALLRNLGGGRFAPSDEGAFEPADTHGLSWVDLDGDGRLDLYVSIGAARGYGEGPNHLYRGTGGGFRRDGELPEVLADPSGRGRCSMPGDLDGDGLLDLAVLNAPQPGRPHRLALRRGGVWLDGAAEAGLVEIDAECLAAVAAGPSGEPIWVAYGAGADSGRLYARSDAGRLEDVTEALGVAPGLAGVMAVASGDVDNDGDLDLYLVAGGGVPPAVVAGDGRIDYRLVAAARDERPGFRFEASGELRIDVLVAGVRRPDRVRLGGAQRPAGRLPWVGVADDAALEGVPALDGEAEIGVYLWRDGDELVLRFIGDGARFRAASGAVEAAGGIELIESTEVGAHRRDFPNRLLVNRDGRFADDTVRAGVGNAASGRDAVLADLDNDGDLDLFVVNGGAAFANLPDALYENRGDGVFADVTATAGVAGTASGRGATALAFDADGDGDLDLFTTNGDGPPPGNDGPWQLWRNDSPAGRSISVDLEGRPGNTAGFGAVVTARFGGRILAVARSATTSRYATSVLPLHIGIGDADIVDLEVVWPSGARTRASARPGDHLILHE